MEKNRVIDMCKAKGMHPYIVGYCQIIKDYIPPTIVNETLLEFLIFTKLRYKKYLMLNMHISYDYIIYLNIFNILNI